MRNLPIVVHIDYDKSTLSDRTIQIYGGLSDHEMEAQALGSMDFERERSTTIKAQSVTFDSKASDGEAYQFNFIDTPGRVDFPYGVSRSLAVYEGALLVVDVGQGVEAQTPANCYTTTEMGLEAISVLNKIDLPAVDPERVVEEIEDTVDIDATGAIRCSAKIGVGVTGVLEHLVRDTPSPEGDPEDPLRALIVDSWFDDYLGVMSLVHIRNGTIHKGDKIKVMSTGQVYSADRLGIFTSKQVDRTELKYGEVGWLIYVIKDILGAPVGDTLMQARDPADKPLPGSKKVKPQVYADLFPVNSDDYENFRDALGKLSLNDTSLFYEPESSTALGFGFRCDFPDLLYMKIIQEHLERECGLDLITTAPAVVYEVETTAEETTYIDSPFKLLPLNNIYELCEPAAECHMLLPQAYLSNVITLCTEKHGVQTNMAYHGNQVALMYEIPMAGVVLDSFGCLKSTPRGYAPLDYNFKRFQASDMVHVDVLISNERIGALALITHRDNSQDHGRELVEEMKDLIPRQQFNIVIQAAIDTHITARSTAKQLRRNVLARCYGGGISHKKKLLQKQKEDKKHMKRTGSVELPQEAFLTILYVGKDSR